MCYEKLKLPVSYMWQRGRKRERERERKRDEDRTGGVSVNKWEAYEENKQCVGQPRKKGVQFLAFPI